MRIMRRWSVVEMHSLAEAVAKLGDCFLVRRILHRLDRGELTIQEAIARLSDAAHD